MADKKSHSQPFHFVLALCDGSSFGLGSGPGPGPWLGTGQGVAIEKAWKLYWIYFFEIWNSKYLVTAVYMKFSFDCRASFPVHFWYEYLNNSTIWPRPGLEPVPGPKINWDLDWDPSSGPEITKTGTGTGSVPGPGPKDVLCSAWALRVCLALFKKKNTYLHHICMETYNNAIILTPSLYIHILIWFKLASIL